MSILCCPGSYFLLDPEFSYWSLENGRAQGLHSAEAFFVRCDLTTMTQNDLNNGSLILVVGVAPLQPAEFIFLKITIQI
jgi:phage tail sheath protein FI